jgi:hypothetical protein
VLTIALIVFGVEGEAGLGLTLSYWLFIGLSQCLYLIPAIGVAVVTKRPQVAWGLVRGGGIIAVVNVVASVLGRYIGPC